MGYWYYWREPAGQMREIDGAGGHLVAGGLAVGVIAQAPNGKLPSRKRLQPT
jgi:hypothetical protein